MTLFSLPIVLPRSTHYSRLAILPESTAEEIRAAAARLDARLRAEARSEADLAEAHRISLESQAGRTEHDTALPPLLLMRLEPTWNSIFEDRGAELAVLRREIENFLLRAGEVVRRPTDVDRTDFTNDYTYCGLIDDNCAEVDTDD